MPTLVIHRRDDSVVPFSEAEGFSGIPNAKLSALPGTDHYIWSGDVVPIIDAIEEFFRGTAAFRVRANDTLHRCCSSTSSGRSAWRPPWATSA